MITVGITETAAVQVQEKLFTTHGMVVGSSGSGKTGLLVALAEELLRNGRRVIVVDTKGDLATLANHNVVSTIITPGLIDSPLTDLALLQGDVDTVTRRVLHILGEDPDPATSNAYYFVHWAVRKAAKTIYIPSELQFGDFQGFSDEWKNPTKATMKRIQQKAAAKTDLLFSLATGAPANIMEILTTETDGNPVQLVVFSLAFLGDEEKLAMQAVILEMIWEFTKECGGQDTAHTVCIFDECADLVPPVKKTPTKTLMVTLLKQARAFGVGMLLSTQNPGDIDYKAIANCATWWVGRLPMQQDRKRLFAGVPELREGAGMVATLKPREFALLLNGEVQKVRSMDCVAELTGPLSMDQLDSIPTHVSWFVPQTYAPAKEESHFFTKVGIAAAAMLVLGSALAWVW